MNISIDYRRQYPGQPSGEFNRDASGGTAAQSITQAFDTLVTVGTGIALSVVAFMILWGGFKYMTARGNPLAMEKAKSTLEHAAIGFGIVVLCQVLAQLLQSTIHV